MKNKISSLLLTAAGAFLLVMPSVADESNPPPTTYTAKAQHVWERTEKRIINDDMLNMDMLAMIYECFGEVDQYLNLAYEQAIDKLQSRAPHLVEKLKADQRAWLAFVEPLTDEIFGNFGDGGTAYYEMGASSRVRFWIQRIGYLEMIVDEASSELLPG